MTSGSSERENAVSPLPQAQPSPPQPGEQPPIKTDTFRERKGVDILNPFSGERRKLDVMDPFGESEENPLEKDEGVDLIDHAQKVLGKVQSSKRDMELQTELEEAQRAFGDFVQALGSANEDG